MDDNTFFSSVSGVMQVEDPIHTVVASSDQPISTISKPNRGSSTSSIPTIKKTQTKRITSVTNSPIPSRESSPVRPQIKSSSSSRSTDPGRSRKNSSQDVSPSRSASINTTNPLSAAATQRALSATSIPHLQAVASESSIITPTPLKPSVTTELKDGPRWPISPRLRSPPPINKPSIVSPRKTEQDLPVINVQRASQPTAQQEGKQAPTDSETDDSLSITGMRTPARGASGGSTLETVQEISQPNTPALGLDGALEKREDGTSRLLIEQDNPVDNAFSKTLKPKTSLAANESGSESGGKGEIKMRATAAAPAQALRANVPPTKSYSTSTAAGRGKPLVGEGSTRNMTVETETVSSIPQVAVGGGVGGVGNNGSLRAKPSSETIRPKKEKKKTARKAPSVTSGTASSKADIFEAKVASAVDEANSSDSEETFVYESNPPEANDRPRRFHSRTPSATSMASQVDQRNGVRSIHGAMDGGHSVAMKKSMKFANSYTSNGPETAAGEDDGKGTARSNMGTSRGTTHHHHIGRWGRNGGNGHPSLFDNESPFPNAAKTKLAGNTTRHSSRPTSPRVSKMVGNNGKKGSPVSSGYDLDDGIGADDERAPLISTIRSVRSTRSRRPAASSMRQLEHQASRHSQSFLNRFAGCLVLSVMIILVISGAIGFMFATTQPLTEVRVTALKNVIASEQEIMLDMQVMARNPNLVVVTVDSMDINVFAKSKHVGTDSGWWKRPQIESKQNRRRRWNKHTRDDDPNDPPIDDPDATQTLLLGRIFEFDSPLIFEGSPFHHSHSSSMGEVRLAKPGNKTEAGGTERWERVLKYEFDLILRGVLKYTLPLSQRVRSVGVEGKVTIKPNTKNSYDYDHVYIV